MRELQPVFLCSASLDPSSRDSVSTSVYRVGRQIEFYDDQRGPVRAGPEANWGEEEIRRAVAAAFGVSSVDLIYDICEIVPAQPDACARPRFVRRIGQCLSYEDAQGNPVRSAPRETWQREDIEREVRAAYPDTPVTLRFSKGPRKFPCCFDIPFVGQKRHHKIPESYGSAITAGKDFAALAKLRARYVEAHKGASIPREIEVDIHRWFTSDYIFRKRGEWFGRGWTVFSDLDLGDSSSVAEAWLQKVRIPRYASQTDAALKFAGNCLPPGRHLALRQKDTEEFTLWRAEVTNEAEDLVGTGEDVTPATAITQAVLDAILREGPFSRDDAAPPGEAA